MKKIIFFLIIAASICIVLMIACSPWDGDGEGEMVTVTINLGSPGTARKAVNTSSGEHLDFDDYEMILNSTSGSVTYTPTVVISSSLPPSISLSAKVKIGQYQKMVIRVYDEDSGKRRLRAEGKHDTTFSISATGLSGISSIDLFSATEVDSWAALAADIAFGDSVTPPRPEVFVLINDGTAGSWDATASISINRPITLQTRGAVTITSDSISPSPYTSSFFSVGAGGALVLEGTLTLDGGGGAGITKTASLIQVNNGSLEINTGVTITGGNYSQGGGVYVGSNGTFTMSGGAISGNEEPSAGTPINGGGVYVAPGGSFTMSGGVISSNTASNGGGVYVDADNTSAGSFTMNGGDIIDNIANADGGGVAVIGGTFTMNNGTIGPGNKADGAVGAGGSGGGVYADGQSKFTMNNGQILGNIAISNGGGVAVSSSVEFIKTGGTIYGTDKNIDPVDPFNPGSGYELPESTANISLNLSGHAVWYNAATSAYRNTTAIPGDSCDTTTSGYDPALDNFWY